MYLCFLSLLFDSSVHERGCGQTPNQGTWKKATKTWPKVSLQITENWLLEVQKKATPWAPPWHWKWCEVGTAQSGWRFSVHSWIFRSGNFMALSRANTRLSTVWPSLCFRNLKDEFLWMDAECHPGIGDGEVPVVHDGRGCRFFIKQPYWGANCMDWKYKIW